ncbi:hypothetical protein [uncultured Lutibacter sp.]|uniref:hypothetical protein n=1 Tax=uncultured Lutibacter sp. TaxID=437739 RepID=UPI00261B21D8|nr:hypothetical protein [uncultured Lutibacter sp.]
MKNVFKIASILAFIIGIMSIVAGSKVLLGIDTKNYTVLNWLVTYNVIYGFISIIVAYLIWTTNKFTKKAIIFILASHITLLFYLSFFNENVASESIKAMVFRISIWSIIALLTLNLKTQSK